MFNVRAASSPSKLRKARGLLGAFSKHANACRVDAANRCRLVNGNNAGRNIFKNCFHQSSPALELLHGLLEVLSKNIDLTSAVAELSGHSVERTDKSLQFILSLDIDARLIITGDDLLCRLRQSLDRNGDLFGQIERKPRGRKHQENRKQEKRQQ